MEINLDNFNLTWTLDKENDNSGSTIIYKSEYIPFIGQGIINEFTYTDLIEVDYFLSDCEKEIAINDSCKTLEEAQEYFLGFVKFKIQEILKFVNEHSTLEDTSKVKYNNFRKEYE